MTCVGMIWNPYLDLDMKISQQKYLFNNKVFFFFPIIWNTYGNIPLKYNMQYLLNGAIT